MKPYVGAQAWRAGAFPASYMETTTTTSRRQAAAGLAAVVSIQQLKQVPLLAPSLTATDPSAASLQLISLLSAHHGLNICCVPPAGAICCPCFFPCELTWSCLESPVLAHAAVVLDI